jgi:quercetin dioxygenase-like cupin family protein
MLPYSSRDFGATAARIAVEIPEKLVHRNVIGSGLDERFSEARRHPVQVVDLPSKTISMTIGGLLPGQVTSRHRHTYETILYVMEGEGTTFVEDREIRWKAGDAIYIPVWAWHHHENASQTASARYIACENAPLLQNLGGVALREEEADLIPSREG